MDILWRQRRRLPKNRSSEGPLTDLPDFSYLDGRPSPLGVSWISFPMCSLSLFHHLATSLHKNLRFQYEKFPFHPINRVGSAKVAFGSTETNCIENRPRNTWGGFRQETVSGQIAGHRKQATTYFECQIEAKGSSTKRTTTEEKSSSSKRPATEKILPQTTETPRINDMCVCHTNSGFLCACIVENDSSNDVK